MCGHWRLKLLVVSREHAFESVHGGKHDLEFMSNFAELGEAASGGITFERVHGAAHGANELFVRRTLLKLQTGIIDGLQQFAGALKEQRTKLRTAVIGKEGQETTSMRL